MAIRTFQGVTPSLGQRVFIDDTSVVLGDVALGDDCSVWPMAVIRGDVHRIRIGARCGDVALREGHRTARGVGGGRDGPAAARSRRRRCRRRGRRGRSG